MNIGHEDNFCQNIKNQRYDLVNAKYCKFIIFSSLHDMNMPIHCSGHFLHSSCGWVITGCLSRSKWSDRLLWEVQVLEAPVNFALASRFCECPRPGVTNLQHTCH